MVSKEINPKSSREIGSYFGQSYHCRQVDKIPNMNTRKAEMLDFMKRNTITVPEPLPTKPVPLELIKMANIQKKFAIDSIAFENGHLVLGLPPHHF